MSDEEKAALDTLADLLTVIQRAAVAAIRQANIAGVPEIADGMTDVGAVAAMGVGLVDAHRRMGEPE